MLFVSSWFSFDRHVCTSEGRRSAKLYAYDKATGREVANLTIPAPQTGNPMSYMLNRKQYLVVAISGPDCPAELIAYTVAP